MARSESSHHSLKHFVQLNGLIKMTNIKAYLVEGHGRSSVFTSPQPWANDDPDYNVVPLVPMKMAEFYAEEFAEGVPKEPLPSLPNTDDTQERIQLMEELFTLQETDITLLKAQLEKFVEVVEGISELTEVISQNAVENRSKLWMISESCKGLLKPSE